MLTKDIEAANDRQRALDKEAYRYFLDVAANKDEVRRHYGHFQSISRRYGDFANLVNEMLNGVQPLYEGGLTREQVQGIIRAIKSKYEPGLNKAYRSLMEDGLISQAEDADLHKALIAFLEKDYRYYIDGKFQNNELGELRGLGIRTANLLNERKFAAYRRLLEQQLAASSTEVSLERR